MSLFCLSQEDFLGFKKLKLKGMDMLGVKKNFLTFFFLLSKKITRKSIAQLV